MLLTPNEIASGLSQFYGTENYYSYLGGLKLTDGAKYLAEAAECFWIMDLVASYQFDKQVKQESFQTYKLVVNQKDKTAVCYIGDGNKDLLHQNIEYTDFPLPEITIWCVDKVVMLPPEY